MSATIKSVRFAVAHEGVAELILEIQYGNGSSSPVTLDSFACHALMESCAAETAEELIGQDWEKVRDALIASYNRC